MPGTQGPKTVKGVQSHSNYVSRLLARSECLPGGGQKLELRHCQTQTYRHTDGQMDTSACVAVKRATVNGHDATVSSARNSQAEVRS